MLSEMRRPPDGSVNLSRMLFNSALRCLIPVFPAESIRLKPVQATFGIYYMPVIYNAVVTVDSQTVPWGNANTKCARKIKRAHFYACDMGTVLSVALSTHGK